MELLTIKQASEWASELLDKRVTPSNISYLVQYGRIQKVPENGSFCVNKNELAEYYRSYMPKREVEWKEKLGDDLNWHLSFENLKEADTTKHVHRLHPYKGKYIPQLVEYFLDQHTDEFKREVFFNKGDTVLDPFCGSGTTLVQANEMSIHAIGVDVSAFNALISNVKVGKYDLDAIKHHVSAASERLKVNVANSSIPLFEEALLEALQQFNNQWFPVPEYKYQLRQGIINEDNYGAEKEREFQAVYASLVKQYNVSLDTNEDGGFIEKWYLPHIRNEMQVLFDYLRTIADAKTKKIMSVILSRTIRSCRATTHADLATLLHPVKRAYYCSKHGKICKPLFSLQSWWSRYCKDTIQRLRTFDQLSTDTLQFCLTGDSRSIDIKHEIDNKMPHFAAHFNQHKCAGIFSSPPYIGLIDYHEQHAYAYELFGFLRQDSSEIGAMSRGQGREAKEEYSASIAAVLVNAQRFLRDDFNIFLVANDKYNLYPEIASRANLTIVNQFRRPVLNRTEKGKSAYAETIFHMKKELIDA